MATDQHRLRATDQHRSTQFQRDSSSFLGFLCWSVFVCGGALAVAAAQDAAQRLPSFRSGVDIVRLDVSVLDKNRRPVLGLTAADFTITVDGTVQPIVGFDAVVLPPREPPTAPWMRDVAPDVRTNALGEPRLFVIIMDDVQTPPDPYMVNSAKTIARTIVDQLAPSDLASVVFTKDNRGAQDFTSDRARLLAAIDSFHYGWIPEFMELPGRMNQETVRNAVAFLRGRPHGRNAIMLISVGGGIVPEPDVTSRSDTAGLMGGAGDVADMLAREAHETRIATEAGLAALTRDAALARIPIYGFSIAGLMAEGQAAVNTAAPVELRAPRFTARSGVAGNDGLRTLAAASGGRALVDDNDPARAVAAVFEENSAYYVVGYKATYGLADGRTHRLKIRVNRPDATVFPSDRQLLSAKPAAKKNVTEPPPPLLRAIAEMVPRSDLRMAVVAAPFALPIARDPRAPTSGVLATLRVTRPAPAERTTEQVQVLAIVFTPEGKEVGSIRQNAALRLRPADSDAEFDVLTPLALKPGRYNVRFSAHSVSLGKTGSVYTDVTIPEFEKEKLSLSGVVVSADPTLAAAPKDAFAAIIPVVPTTKREFDRSDRAQAFVRMYAGGRQPPARVEVTARVTDASATAVVVKTEAVAAERFGPKRSADYTYDLPLGALAPGSYLLTLEARADAVTVRRDVRFSVR
jgi:VWFA-related protein